MTLTFGELFAGIGGPSLGLERAGMRAVWHVELDERCRAVLAQHFPDSELFADVRDVGAHNLARVDVVVGGFPCQPISAAGKRKGRSDIRWLWPEFARIVRELRPHYVVVENVPTLRSLDRGSLFAEVLGDLATLGYDAEWDCLPASAFGAPHDRDRIFLVAYPQSECESLRTPTTERPRRLAGGGATVAHPNREGKLQPLGRVIEVGGWTRDPSAAVEDADCGPVEPRGRRWRVTQAGEVLGWGAWAAEPGVGRMAHGVPDRLDRLTEIGNAALPQIFTYLGRRILEDANRD